MKTSINFFPICSVLIMRIHARHATKNVSHYVVPMELPETMIKMDVSAVNVKTHVVATSVQTIPNVQWIYNLIPARVQLSLLFVAKVNIT